MADRQSACKGRRKRGPVAVEAPEYVGTTKTCTHCASTEHSVFKFLNNQKPDQPRYKCMRCNTWYTHCSPGKVRTRAHGKKYHKHTLANPPEHAALFDLRCPNLACRAANPPEVCFLYDNNNKPSQPRYVWRACHVAWQPKLKNLPPGPDQVAPTVSEGSWTEFYPNGDPTYMDATQGQQQYCDPNYMNAIQGQSFANGAPDYMAATQAQQQYFDPANNLTSMGSCVGYPNGASYFVDAMQDALQGEQQYVEPASYKVTSMGSCIEYPNGAPNYLDVAADALQLGGEQHALFLDLDPPSPEFHAMDADTTQGAEEQDAREADWGMDEWMGELFHAMDADTEQGAEDLDEREAEWGIDEWMAADALQLGGERHALSPDLDPPSPEFHAMDADTTQGVEEQDAREAEWGMDEWMGELFETQSTLGEEE